MTAELIERLDGKVLCSNDGGRIPITKVALVRDRRGKTGDEFYRLEIGGVANAYLINSTDPDDGTQELAEPIAAFQSHDLDKEDSALFLQQLNQHFGLTGDMALVDDGGGWLERFEEDHPKSVLPVIKEKGAYFKAKAKTNAEVTAKFGNSPFFFNFFQPPQRMAVSKSSLAEVRKRMKASREAAEARRKEEEELVG